METPPDRSEQPAPRRGGPPLVLLGALGAVVAGGAIAWALLSGDHPSPPPPASEGGLIIDASGAEDAGRIDPGKPLRCFVQGRFVGDLSLTDCAQRNGVATDALDVGVDETGALAAADQTAQMLTPLPYPTGEAADAGVDGAGDVQADPPPAAAPAAQTCQRHAGGRWRKVSEGGDLNACVQALFAGACEKSGQALYGRYGSQTLRLVTGRVEIADDNRTFRPLAPQGADCAIPPVG
ncbi:MAG: hypothetical protein JNL41_04090 [Phenylobacterium sp.]|uniref:hypothetical protein n=1 Tax=Phenylobacterium sp. TaxID=1871053 RepID=UPI001A5971E2|nr:hypothetical protein [Phenylobacterium sp.]MBL8553435.1 hypothetical protein [Phenylobacterium sp.]